MKLLFVSPQLYPCTTGGAEIFNYHFINAMRRFHKVNVITFCSKFSKDAFVIKKIKPIKIFTTLQILLYLLRNRDVDIVHVSFMGRASKRWIIYPLLKRLFGLDYIVTIHGGGLFEWQPYWPLKTFFKHAKHITAVSHRALEEYEKRTNRIVHFTPPLVPFTNSEESIIELKQKHDLPRNSKIVLYVGSIKSIKGTDVLIKSFLKFDINYLKRENLYLLLAGTGPLKMKLETEVINSKISEHIIFLGKVSNELVHTLYKIANYYVISSHFENTPISMLEAMYNKRAIIASDAPGINDIIANDKNGFLFKKNDPVDLYEKILYLIENPKIAHKLGNNAYYDYCKLYSYDALIKTFNGLLNYSTD